MSVRNQTDDAKFMWQHGQIGGVRNGDVRKGALLILTPTDPPPTSHRAGAAGRLSPAMTKPAESRQRITDHDFHWNDDGA
jgi:hypothetical protein